MPKLARIIKLYTCDFKCGHKADLKYKITHHEEICFCNPKNKSCRICENCEVSAHNMYCNKKKLYIINLEKPHKVYNFNDETIWEKKHLNYLSDIIFNEEKYNEICKHNSNMPFPTKNCEYFILSKKKF